MPVSVLREWREAAGKSREEMAVALGVAFDTIGRWERRQDVDPKGAKLYAVELGVPPEVLGAVLIGDAK